MEAQVSRTEELRNEVVQILVANGWRGNAADCMKAADAIIAFYQLANSPFKLGQSYSVYTAYAGKRFAGEAVQTTKDGWLVLEDAERKSLAKGEIWLQISHIIGSGPRE